jgi:hypothetical protein
MTRQSKETERGELLSGANPQEADTKAAEFRNALRSRGPRAFWQKNLEVTLSAYRLSGNGYFDAIGLAGAYARVGDRENAFKWLDKSFDDKEGQTITLVKRLADFKSLQSDPRFADLLRRMGLPH